MNDWALNMLLSHLQLLVHFCIGIIIKRQLVKLSFINWFLNFLMTPLIIINKKFGTRSFLQFANTIEINATPIAAQNNLLINDTNLSIQHIIEYFIVGTTTILFCTAMGRKPWTGFLAACLFGLLEETLKNFLPTREFSGKDVFKDFLGAALALLMILVISSIHKRRSYSHISEESNNSQGRRSAEWERI